VFFLKPRDDEPSDGLLSKENCGLCRAPEQEIDTNHVKRHTENGKIKTLPQVLVFMEFWALE